MTLTDWLLIALIAAGVIAVAIRSIKRKKKGIACSCSDGSGSCGGKCSACLERAMAREKE